MNPAPRLFRWPAKKAQDCRGRARTNGIKESIADNTTGIAQDARALMVEPHSTAGRLKIGRSALDKRTNYRGMTANRLTRQVTGFRAFDKDGSTIKARAS